MARKAMPASGEATIPAIRGRDSFISWVRWKSSVQSSCWQWRKTRTSRTGSSANTPGPSAASSWPRTMNPSTRRARRRRAILRVSRMGTFAPLDLRPIASARRLSTFIEVWWIAWAQR